MLPFYKKYWRTIFDIGLIVLTVFLAMWLFSLIYNVAKPIFFALVIFVCIEPLAKRLHKLGMKKSIAAAISAILFTLIVLGAIGALIFIATVQGTELISNLPKYQKMLTANITNGTLYLQEQLGRLPFDFDVVNQLTSALQSASDKIQQWLMAGLTFVISSITSFTSFVFNAAVGLILAYFLSIEILDWKRIANEKTPNTFKKAFFFLRDNVLRGIWVYIKAQAKLISVTFLVILVSLLLLGVEHSLVISLVAALFDILPLLGVSTIFIPWITYLFIVGDYSLGIWITALWLVVILARQLLEPKITGDSLGVSAFTMLAFMIISLSLFGVAGMILSPVLVILIKALYEQGYFKQWIRKPIGEYDTMEPVEEDVDKDK
ncbi:sporulation integral membrane protein YtvI [Paenibacillus montaniterrae]|uniref:Sporulation integral membrane protein YtvI n=1 Tax=Paenibacillus montaniterrae TaxID=429341 RepID=A0A919YR65_9BACL|nr:AI-2E family transporter [Paenibacillus montaniterrae]GIP16846.1 sporulation integral membrane protein YtvI [Paenibacillus montaniterrae]